MLVYMLKLLFNNTVFVARMVYCWVVLWGEFAAFYFIDTAMCSIRLSSFCTDTCFDVHRHSGDNTIPQKR